MHYALLRFLTWPRREEGAYPQRSVTDEQRRPGQKAEQPSGRERFGASGGVARSFQTTAGMRVARALPSTPKRSRAKCMGISTDSSLLSMTHQIHNYLLVIFATFGVAAGAHSVAAAETAFVFKDQPGEYLAV